MAVHGIQNIFGMSWKSKYILPWTKDSNTFKLKAMESNSLALGCLKVRVVVDRFISRHDDKNTKVSWQNTFLRTNSLLSSIFIIMSTNLSFSQRWIEGRFDTNLKDKEEVIVRFVSTAGTRKRRVRGHSCDCLHGQGNTILSKPGHGLRHKEIRNWESTEDTNLSQPEMALSSVSISYRPWATNHPTHVRHYLENHSQRSIKNSFPNMSSVGWSLRKKRYISADGDSRQSKDWPSA